MCAAPMIVSAQTDLELFNTVIYPALKGTGATAASYTCPSSAGELFCDESDVVTGM